MIQFQTYASLGIDDAELLYIPPPTTHEAWEEDEKSRVGPRYEKPACSRVQAAKILEYFRRRLQPLSISVHQSSPNAEGQPSPPRSLT